MVDAHTAKLLARYKAWADEVFFAGVAALPPGEAEKERKTLFKTIIGTLNHSYVVDLIWQAHLERRALGLRNSLCRTGDFRTLTSNDSATPPSTCESDSRAGVRRACRRRPRTWRRSKCTARRAT